MGTYNWSIDKDDSKDIAEVATFLHQKTGHKFTHYNTGYRFPFFDLWDNDSPETYEVKRDDQSQDTGNIAIELNCLKESLASRWIYILKDEYLLFPEKNLKTLAEKGRLVMGGDNRLTKLSVVPLQLARKYAKSYPRSGKIVPELLQT